MKSLKYFPFVFLLLLVIVSCEEDNYEGPSATFRGSVIDAETREPFQTAIGPTGIRFTLMEYSWSENPTPYYMYSKMDGTFNNTKIFEGEYGVTPEGAFVPLEEEIFEIKDTVEKEYEVEPFLRLEWLEDPTLNANGTVTVRVKITRGTSDTLYQQPLADVWLLISETEYVGDFSYSPNYSTHLFGPDVPALERAITIVSGWPAGIDNGVQRSFPEYPRKYFLRVAARTEIQVNSTNVYNYSTVKEITTP